MSRAVLVFILFLLCQPVPPACADSPLGKLTRGVSNALFGTGEYVVHLGKQMKAHGPLTGFFGAAFYGTYYTLIRTVAGVYETGTFLIPLPWHYESVIQPETLF